MAYAAAGIRHGLRWGALGLVAVLAATAVCSDPADARSRRRKAVKTYSPAYASIVVDANTGVVLQSTNAKDKRYPASLTKVMTLYLLFEQLEAGKLKLNSELKVSAHASRQAPSKLALKPGQTITVESAIRAIVTKSANDVAVVIAETIGGEEDDFARMMTRKARALGMDHTTYRNASGLPNDEQITTAMDQALLGRAIRDRFPKYFHYFSVRSYAYHGKSMRNHNMLLGHVEGVDGIKTGYTYASGFNLLTSVKRGNRYIVAAVFGGRTGNARDARMKQLIASNIRKASEKRTAPMLNDSPEIAMPQPRTRVATASAGAPVPSAPKTVSSGPAPGSTDPIKPNAVKTFQVKASSTSSAALGPVATPDQQLSRSPLPSNGVSVKTVATVKSEPPALPPGMKQGASGHPPTRVASADDSLPVSSTSTASAKTRGGWVIQVGAFDNENDAKKRLTVAQDQAKKLLGQADPFTERVAKGDKTLYRARFAGFEKDQAEAVCTHLKRGEIPCMLFKN